MKTFLVDFLVSGHHMVYAGHLSRYLLEFGHEVTFWAWGPDSRLQALADRGVEIRYVTSGGAAIPEQTFRMIPPFSRGLRSCLKAAAEERADVVHLLYLDRAMPLPLWWNRWWSEVRIPTFGTLFWPHYFVDTLRPNLGERLYHTLVRKALKDLLCKEKLTVLFTHTERLKQKILHGLQLESLAHRCIVVPDPIPDPINMSGKTWSQQECRARLGLPQECITLLFFGDMRESKGPDILLQAMRSLPPEVFVVFAGDPKGNRTVLDGANYLSAQHLDGRARFDLTRVPDDLLPVYFQASDAVVLPYRRSYLGTSGVLQHAAWAKKPVITADVGELGDLVRQHGLGLVIEPEEPQRLAEGVQRYIRERGAVDAAVAERAPLYSSQNHWRQTGASVVQAYQRAIAASRPRPSPSDRR
jgi:glycosyltransferase involved in cell wall biosynthesis